ncbi:hypothetical protein ANN_01733 [Periplaneta americana]|uniref:Alpha-carbonic anhydrase domain-containing protein n=1 Tax=Periplaneta americana TaxID=6978 RepID=A0ABQ8TUG5_PERAM|nr:hypothetical protein ANN_01733 [Periplaneta americana]
MDNSEGLRSNVERIQKLSDTDGKFFAPIDINLSATQSIDLPPLSWYNYDIPPKKMKITNTAHTGEGYNACSSALCNFLHSPVTSSLLAPNIFLRTLFSKTLNLCSSLKVRVQVSQPYRTTSNITVIHLQLDHVILERWQYDVSCFVTLLLLFTVILSAKWMDERPFLADGPIIGNYVFSQLHFHWGIADEEGSEHTAEGHNFPLEMHVVHFKSDYGTQEVALRERDGLLIIIYFFKLQNEDNPNMQELIDSLTCIEVPHTSVHIDLKPITTYLRPFDSDYFAYWGSVMTSTCSHRILWLISREPIGISSRQVIFLLPQVARLRFLRGENNLIMTNNYRQVQPINNRSVFHVSPSTALDATILQIPTTPHPNIIKRGPGRLMQSLVNNGPIFPKKSNLKTKNITEEQELIETKLKNDPENQLNNRNQPVFQDPEDQLSSQTRSIFQNTEN